MAKKIKKVAVFSIVFVVLLVFVVGKIIFFDIVRIQGATNLTEYTDNSILLVQKNKTPDFADILLIQSPSDFNEQLIRCIAKPGQKIEIINSDIFIDGVQQIEKFETLKKYRVNCFNPNSTNRLLNYYKLASQENILGVYYLNLSKKMADSLLSDSLIMIKQIIAEAGLGNDSIFPQSFKYRWNEDNFGQTQVPYSGFSIELNELNYSMYRNTIAQFEGKTIQKNQQGEILVDGSKVTTYVFENDYYFVLNDNRTNLNDSRNWGFIPSTLIKGVVLSSL